MNYRLNLNSLSANITFSDPRCSRASLLQGGKLNYANCLLFVISSTGQLSLTHRVLIVIVVSIALFDREKIVICCGKQKSRKSRGNLHENPRNVFHHELAPHDDVLEESQWHSPVQDVSGRHLGDSPVLPRWNCIPRLPFHSVPQSTTFVLRCDALSTPPSTTFSRDWG